VSEFTSDIRHTPGVSNTVADALSGPEHVAAALNFIYISGVSEVAVLTVQRAHHPSISGTLAPVLCSGSRPPTLVIPAAPSRASRRPSSQTASAASQIWSRGPGLALLVAPPLPPPMSEAFPTPIPKSLLTCRSKGTLNPTSVLAPPAPPAPLPAPLMVSPTPLPTSLLTCRSKGVPDLQSAAPPPPVLVTMPPPPVVPGSGPSTLV